MSPCLLSHCCFIGVTHLFQPRNESNQKLWAALHSRMLSERRKSRIWRLTGNVLRPCSKAALMYVVSERKYRSARTCTQPSVVRCIKSLNCFSCLQMDSELRIMKCPLCSASNLLFICPGLQACWSCLPQTMARVKTGCTSPLLPMLYQRIVMQAGQSGTRSFWSHSRCRSQPCKSEKD